MKIPKIEITPERFYLVGKYMFTITGVMGLMRIIDQFSMMPGYALFSTIATTIFQFVLAAFFAHLQGKENIKEINDGDVFKMQEALDKLNLDQKKDD